MSEELPAVARMYYSGAGNRRYKRASTRSGPGEPLCFVSVASYALRRRDAEIAMLRLAIQKTLDENGHLADGDNCTLIRLKRALETPNATLYTCESGDSIATRKKHLCSREEMEAQQEKPKD